MSEVQTGLSSVLRQVKLCLAQRWDSSVSVQMWSASNRAMEQSFRNLSERANAEIASAEQQVPLECKGASPDIRRKKGSNSKE